MIHASDTPAHGNFLAYIERVTGKPPASPEQIVQTARRLASARGQIREEDTVPAARTAHTAQAAHTAPLTHTTSSAPSAHTTGAARGQVAARAGFPDFELAKLAPIGRGLTLAGFAVIAAAILLDDWLPLPSPFAGVVLVFLGVMLRRLSRATLGSGGLRFPTRKT